MSGIRVHHLTERNCVLRLRHPGEIKRFGRKTLNKGRKAKWYPIHIDAEGNSILSETVWNRLLEAGHGDQFMVLNEVKVPPPLVINFNEPVELPVIKEAINGMIQNVEPQGSPTYVRGYRG